MSTTATAEVYFIGAMMILILVICVVTVYFFFRQYRKEMRDRKTPRVGSEQTGSSEAKEEGGH
jgi:hypothetical protein